MTCQSFLFQILSLFLTLHMTRLHAAEPAETVFVSCYKYTQEINLCQASVGAVLMHSAFAACSQVILSTIVPVNITIQSSKDTFQRKSIRIPESGRALFDFIDINIKGYDYQDHAPVLLVEVLGVGWTCETQCPGTNYMRMDLDRVRAPWRCVQCAQRASLGPLLYHINASFATNKAVLAWLDTYRVNADQGHKFDLLSNMVYLDWCPLSQSISQSERIRFCPSGEYFVEFSRFSEPSADTNVLRHIGIGEASCTGYARRCTYDGTQTRLLFRNAVGLCVECGENTNEQGPDILTLVGFSAARTCVCNSGASKHKTFNYTGYCVLDPLQISPSEPIHCPFNMKDLLAMTGLLKNGYFNDVIIDNQARTPGYEDKLLVRYYINVSKCPDVVSNKLRHQPFSVMLSRRTGCAAGFYMTAPYQLQDSSCVECPMSTYMGSVFPHYHTECLACTTKKCNGTFYDASTPNKTTYESSTGRSADILCVKDDGWSSPANVPTEWPGSIDTHRYRPLTFVSCATGTASDAHKIWMFEALWRAGLITRLNCYFTCADGHYWEMGVCLPCRPGTARLYANDNWLEISQGIHPVCQECPAGTFQPAGGSSSCIVCPTGSYCPRASTSARECAQIQQTREHNVCKYQTHYLTSECTQGSSEVNCRQCPETQQVILRRPWSVFGIEHCFVQCSVGYARSADGMTCNACLPVANSDGWVLEIGAPGPCVPRCNQGMYRRPSANQYECVACRRDEAYILTACEAYAPAYLSDSMCSGQRNTECKKCQDLARPFQRALAQTSAIYQGNTSSARCAFECAADDTNAYSTTPFVYRRPMAVAALFGVPSALVFVELEQAGYHGVADMCIRVTKEAALHCRGYGPLQFDVSAPLTDRINLDGQVAIPELWPLVSCRKNVTSCTDILFAQEIAFADQLSRSAQGVSCYCMPGYFGEYDILGNLLQCRACPELAQTSLVGAYGASGCWCKPGWKYSAGMCKPCWTSTQDDMRYCPGISNLTDLLSRVHPLAQTSTALKDIYTKHIQSIVCTTHDGDGCLCPAPRIVRGNKFAQSVSDCVLPSYLREAADGKYELCDNRYPQNSSGITRWVYGNQQCLRECKQGAVFDGAKCVCDSQNGYEVHPDYTVCTCMPGWFRTHPLAPCTLCERGRYCLGQEQTPLYCGLDKTSYVGASAPSDCYCLEGYYYEYALGKPFLKCNLCRKYTYCSIGCESTVSAYTSIGECQCDDQDCPYAGMTMPLTMRPGLIPETYVLCDDLRINSLLTLATPSPKKYSLYQPKRYSLVVGNLVDPIRLIQCQPIFGSVFAQNGKLVRRTEYMVASLVFACSIQSAIVHIQAPNSAQSPLAQQFACIEAGAGVWGALDSIPPVQALGLNGFLDLTSIPNAQLLLQPSSHLVWNIVQYCVSIPDGTTWHEPGICLTCQPEIGESVSLTPVYNADLSVISAKNISEYSMIVFLSPAAQLRWRKTQDVVFCRCTFLRSSMYLSIQSVPLHTKAPDLVTLYKTTVVLEGHSASRIRGMDAIAIPVWRFSNLSTTPSDTILVSICLFDRGEDTLVLVVNKIPSGVTHKISTLCKGCCAPQVPRHFMSFDGVRGWLHILAGDSLLEYSLSQENFFYDGQDDSFRQVIPRVKNISGLASRPVVAMHQAPFFEYDTARLPDTVFFFILVGRALPSSYSGQPAVGAVECQLGNTQACFYRSFFNITQLEPLVENELAKRNFYKNGANGIPHEGLECSALVSLDNRTLVLPGADDTWHIGLGCLFALDHAGDDSWNGNVILKIAVSGYQLLDVAVLIVESRRSMQVSARLAYFAHTMYQSSPPYDNILATQLRFAQVYENTRGLSITFYDFSCRACGENEEWNPETQRCECGTGMAIVCLPCAVEAEEIGVLCDTHRIASNMNSSDCYMPLFPRTTTFNVHCLPCYGPFYCIDHAIMPCPAETPITHTYRGASSPDQCVCDYGYKMEMVPVSPNTTQSRCVACNSTEICNPEMSMRESVLTCPEGTQLTQHTVDPSTEYKNLDTPMYQTCDCMPGYYEHGAPFTYENRPPQRPANMFGTIWDDIAGLAPGSPWAVKYTLVTIRSCRVCKENHFCPGDNRQVTCHDNSYSGKGSASCTCKPGWQVWDAAEGCAPCPLRHICYGTLTISCENITGSRRDPSYEAVLCPCLEAKGTYLSADYTCIPCPVGFFCPLLEDTVGISPSIANQPVRCPHLSTTLQPGRDNIQECLCEPGYRMILSAYSINSLAEQGTCVQCLQGWYCPGINPKVTEIQCPGNSTSKAGSFHISNCTCSIPGTTLVFTTNNTWQCVCGPSSRQTSQGECAPCRRPLREIQGCSRCAPGFWRADKLLSRARFVYVNNTDRLPMDATYSVALTELLAQFPSLGTAALRAGDAECAPCPPNMLCPGNGMAEYPPKQDGRWYAALPLAIGHKGWWLPCPDVPDIFQDTSFTFPGHGMGSCFRSVSMWEYSTPPGSRMSTTPYEGILLFNTSTITDTTYLSAFYDKDQEKLHRELFFSAVQSDEFVISKSVYGSYVARGPIDIITIIETYREILDNIRDELIAADKNTGVIFSGLMSMLWAMHVTKKLPTSLIGTPVIAIPHVAANRITRAVCAQGVALLERTLNVSAPPVVFLVPETNLDVREYTSVANDRGGLLWVHATATTTNIFDSLYQRPVSVSAYTTRNLISIYNGGVLSGVRKDLEVVVQVPCPNGLLSTSIKDGHRICKICDPGTFLSKGMCVPCMGVWDPITCLNTDVPGSRFLKNCSWQHDTLCVECDQKLGCLFDPESTYETSLLCGNGIIDTLAGETCDDKDSNCCV